MAVIVAAHAAGSITVLSRDHDSGMSRDLECA
jgi:hypothetical protein